MVIPFFTMRRALSLLTILLACLVASQCYLQRNGLDIARQKADSFGPRGSPLLTSPTLNDTIRRDIAHALQIRREIEWAKYSDVPYFGSPPEVCGPFPDKLSPQELKNVNSFLQLHDPNTLNGVPAHVEQPIVLARGVELLHQIAPFVTVCQVRAIAGRNACDCRVVFANTEKISQIVAVVPYADELFECTAIGNYLYLALFENIRWLAARHCLSSDDCERLSALLQRASPLWNLRSALLHHRSHFVGDPTSVLDSDAIEAMRLTPSTEQLETARCLRVYEFMIDHVLMECGVVDWRELDRLKNMNVENGLSISASKTLSNNLIASVNLASKAEARRRTILRALDLISNSRNYEVVLMDPYSNEPIRVRPSLDGVYMQVYSIGEDRQDDGGTRCVDGVEDDIVLDVTVQ